MKCLIEFQTMSNMWKREVYNSVMGKVLNTGGPTTSVKIFFGKVAASYRQDDISGNFGCLMDVLRDIGWSSEGRKCKDDDPERLALVFEESYKRQKSWFSGWSGCDYINSDYGNKPIPLTQLLIELIHRKHVSVEVVLNRVRRKGEFELELRNFRRSRPANIEGGSDYTQFLDEEDLKELRKAGGQDVLEDVATARIANRVGTSAGKGDDVPGNMRLSTFSAGRDGRMKNVMMEAAPRGVDLDEEVEVVVDKPASGKIWERTIAEKCDKCSKLSEVKEDLKEHNRRLNQAVRDKLCKRFCGNRKRAMDTLEEETNEYVMVRKVRYDEMLMEMERMRQQLKDREQCIVEMENALGIES